MYDFNIGDIVFDTWTIKRLLGRGSFGRVFEIERKDFGETYRSALKVIRVPASEAEWDSYRTEKWTEDQIRQYYYSVVEDFVREFALMSRLKGTANVVGYEDHRVVELPDKKGWIIMIRMEMLKGLMDYAHEHPLTRRDVIRVGIDICRALELCRRHNIIHRDIKPENVFISENGDYKLGDFGVARTVEKLTQNLTQIGTRPYAAPEVFRSGMYDFRVDLYSLGIVLYRLLNRDRLPFMPLPPDPVTPRLQAESQTRRLTGEPLPWPYFGRGPLGAIVLKACAYNPEERYADPAQMRRDLEEVLRTETDSSVIFPDGEVQQTAPDLRGTPMDPYGSMAGPSGNMAGPSGNMTGSSGNMTGPSGNMTGPFGKMTGSEKTAFLPGGANAAPARTGTETLPIGTAAVHTGQSGNMPGAYGGGNASGQAASGTQTGNASGASSGKRGKRGFLLAAAAILVCAAGVFLAYQGFGPGRTGKNGLQTAYTDPVGDAGTAEAAESLPEESAGESAASSGASTADDADRSVRKAYEYYEAGEYDVCISYIEDDLALGKAFDADTQSALAEILGAAYFEKQDYAAAAGFFRLSAAGQDITVSAMRDYAVALGRMGDLDGAEEVLARMREGGADENATRYVEAELAFANGLYAQAEEGFYAVLSTTRDISMQRHAVRSLGEVYRTCAELYKAGEDCPIMDPLLKEVEILRKGRDSYDMGLDPVLLEMLGLADYELWRSSPDSSESDISEAIECFRVLLSMGMTKDYIYVNLYTICYELGDYTTAEGILREYADHFPKSAEPHALLGMLLIARENEKPQDERDYTEAAAEYERAVSLAGGSDDQAYLQQLEDLMQQLEEAGWL